MTASVPKGNPGNNPAKPTPISQRSQAPPDGLAMAQQEVDPISIKSDASLQQAMEIAVDFVGESIPVIDRISGRLIGIVTEADLFRDYLALQNRVVDLERR